MPAYDNRGLYLQPEKELTPQEKLLAEVIGVNERIPVGFQIGMPMHLEASMEAVAELFTKHDLPFKDEVLTELKAWRMHAGEALQFSQECDRLMTQVIRAVSDRVPK